jgi:serine/threonine protein kinase
MYRGRLKDGSIVAVRCLKIKKSHSTQNFMHHIELISKLRHRHLVSALGHCFECYLDDSSVSRMFLVFEYVPNGTLRSWISGNLLICTLMSRVRRHRSYTTSIPFVLGCIFDHMLRLLYEIVNMISFGCL